MFFWLCGPTLSVMDFWRSKIRSMTSDMGTEFAIPDARDILAAFVAFLNGRPMDQLPSLVSPTSRLFRRTLRISGWSHLFGNAMKYCTKYISQWPRIIHLLLSVCNLLRNKTWRRQIIRGLAGVVENVRTRLNTFTANVIK